MSKFLVPGIRIFLGGLFIYSGAIKVDPGRQFATALAPFTILPENLLYPFAIALAFAELLAGALILIPRTARIGATGILLLCMLFIGVLGWALANNIIVDCACFGESTPSAAKMAIAMIRDGVIFGLGLIVLTSRRAKET